MTNLPKNLDQWLIYENMLNIMSVGICKLKSEN